MNILQPWNVVFLCGFVVYFWIRYVFIERTKGRKIIISHFDGLEKSLLAVMFPPTLLLPVLYLFTPVLSFADYQLPAFTPWIGAVTMVLALWLFWRSHVDLGQNWSVSLEVREGHTLITDGVYRYMRHPMYAAIWLWCLAQGMLLPNWLAGWSGIPAFAAMYFLRLPREEQLMYDLFGDEYREYVRQTNRLIPKLWARGMSESAAESSAKDPE